MSIDWSKHEISRNEGRKHIAKALDHLNYARRSKPMPPFMNVVFSRAIALVGDVMDYMFIDEVEDRERQKRAEG